MDYLIIALLFINSAALGLGFFFGYLAIKQTFSKPHEAPKINIEIPPIEVRLDDSEYKKRLELDQQWQEQLRKLATEYYKNLDQKDKENKNRPIERVDTQDLSKTVQYLYDAFLEGKESDGDLDE